MLEEVKQYLRIDGSQDDLLLTSHIFAAGIYFKNATGYDVNEGNELHRLGISLLVTHWFENRESVGKADKLAFSLDSIFQQIKYCGDAS